MQVSLAGVFAPGQVRRLLRRRSPLTLVLAYVALSRCRTLEGLTIDGLGDGACIKAEPLVAEFYQELADNREGRRDASQPSDLVQRYEGDTPFLERMFPDLPQGIYRA